MNKIKTLAFSSVIIFSLNGCQVLKSLDLFSSVVGLYCNLTNGCASPTPIPIPTRDPYPTSFPTMPTDPTPTSEMRQIDLNGTWCIKTHWRSGFIYEGKLYVTEKVSDSHYRGSLELNSTYDPQNIEHSVTQTIDIFIRESTFRLEGSNPIATKANGDTLTYEPDSYTLNIGSNKTSFDGESSDSKGDTAVITMDSCN